MMHEIKCARGFYGALIDGRKTFELRINDRGYQTGDVLRLHETEPTLMGCKKTGNAADFRVTYCLPVMLAESPTIHVILSVTPVRP